jgi:hypothetical protein
MLSFSTKRRVVLQILDSSIYIKCLRNVQESIQFPQTLATHGNSHITNKTRERQIDFCLSWLMLLTLLQAGDGALIVGQATDGTHQFLVEALC